MRDAGNVWGCGKMRRVLTLVAVAMLSGPVSAQEIEDVSLIAGTWRTDTKIEISFRPCEIGECGYISKLIIPEAIYAENKEAIDALGVENITDDRNPDPVQRTRFVLGLPIVTLDKKISPGRYQGKVYNPEDGNTYDGTVSLVDAETLRLTGCAFLIFCQSQEWKRLSEAELADAAAHEAELPGNVGVWHPPAETTAPPKESTQ
jgi:uncharacterized protein (DUF2147 family)